MTPPDSKTWLLGDLLTEAGVAACAPGGGFNPVVRKLAVDSRAVEPGTCFVALAGSKVDGHRFVGDAVARGASAVLVQAGHLGYQCPEAVIVPDTHAAVAKLAAAYSGVIAAQRAGKLKLAGVTGTNGKTTVVTLLRAILEAAGHRVASFGTITNDDGTSSTPANMTTMPPIELCSALGSAVARGATHAVLEVSSHALDQQRCAGLSFSAGVFTNLSRDHLDYHGDMAGYARAKRRLFVELPASAKAVVCADDAYADAMTAGSAARVMRYGLDAARCDVRALRIAVDDDSVRFDLSIGGHEIPIATTLIGSHNIRNIMAASAAAHALGVSPESIRGGIASVACVRGRLERVQSEAPFKVLVDYAHTPDALDNVLAILRTATKQRIICVFGCGGDRDRGKRPLMAQAVARYADVAVVTSDNPRSEDPKAIIADTVVGFDGSGSCVQVVEPDRAAGIRRAIELAEAGDVVLVAGKGHERVQVVAGKELPFDDVAVAQAVLDARFGQDLQRVAS
ncbi:MAG: UDP-N-acetylmuramoyl-L-alanyl-D-glutamate--2,6-diaminopimelate ligase [Phycisphaerales bacterium]|nr:UDP-N-acetylmuramoyl-L-alanyl-D-glutamate--2,6-diaminopimelate ligase [Phycisphaerales bacterium]